MAFFKYLVIKGEDYQWKKACKFPKTTAQSFIENKQQLHIGVVWGEDYLPEKEP